MNRRSFLGFLGALPGLAYLKPTLAKDTAKLGKQFNFRVPETHWDTDLWVENGEFMMRDPIRNGPLHKLGYKVIVQHSRNSSTATNYSQFAHWLVVLGGVHSHQAGGACWIPHYPVKVVFKTKDAQLDADIFKHLMSLNKRFSMTLQSDGRITVTKEFPYDQ